jgi:type I restriction enzyme S subunit
MSELPVGWSKAVGEDLFSYVRGVSYSKSDASTSPVHGTVPILRANNISNARIETDDLVYVPQRYVSPEQFLQAGDLLIAASSGSKSVVGKAACAKEYHTRFAFGAFCTVARPRTELLSAWLSAYTRTKAYRGYVEQIALGININNLRGSDLKAMPICVPPSQEQRRIVAKIDSLSAKSGRARDHLDHLPRLVEKYKQAVLAAAFRGDLTRDWQNAHGLQISWRKALAGELFEWSSGKNLPTKQLVAGSVPVIGGNGVNGQHNQSLIDYPTLVVGRVGAQCGNVHLSLGPAWITDNAIYASQISPEIDLQFAVLLLRSKNLNELAGGSGQPYVSQTILNAIKLALPSVKEQKEIVRRVEHAFTWINHLTSDATNARKLIDHLDQAVLAKAFRGELVPQDPSDEPASVLLERIRAERTAPRRSSGGRGRPRRTR